MGNTKGNARNTRNAIGNHEDMKTALNRIVIRTIEKHGRNTMPTRRIESSTSAILWYIGTGRASADIERTIYSLSYRRLSAMVGKMASTEDWTTEAEIRAMLSYLERI